MINGHFSEAKQGFALLEDVDQATFIRFIRWTYTKDYPVPESTWAPTREGTDTPEGLKNEAAQKDDVLAIRGDDFLASRDNDPKSNEKKVKSGSSTLNTSLGRLFLNLREAFLKQEDNWRVETLLKPRSNEVPQEDYTEIFLSHARLYVFAEKYDIQPLKKLSLQELHRTLAEYTLFPERAGDITTLLKYVYANTAETIDEIEDIRTMLVHYVWMEIETLTKYGEIKDLMLDDGELRELPRDYLFVLKGYNQCS